MKKCFVAQPFDGGKFDKRYNDVFEPAIKKSGLEPYRVDKDYSVHIPIDDIENSIKNSSIVFVDITLDNPNVWYELGYAFACKKDVVMVSCSDERVGAYPFDIRHRQIIQYSSSSASDFTKLEEDITKKLNAFLEKAKTVENISNVYSEKVSGVDSHEFAILLLIMEKQYTPEYSMPVWGLNRNMEQAGYKSIATNIGLRTLVKNKMVEIFEDYDNESGETFTACKLLEKGEHWIMENQHLIDFKNVR